MFFLGKFTSRFFPVYEVESPVDYKHNSAGHFIAGEVGEYSIDD